MGDRANVFVKNQGGKQCGVYLYTHWQGSKLPETVRLALAKRWRWNDPQYLARIIFDTMTAGDHGSETGFGISATIGDNEHPIIVIDCKKQRVGFAKEGEEPDAYRWYSFEEYVKLEEAHYPDK